MKLMQTLPVIGVGLLTVAATSCASVSDSISNSIEVPEQNDLGVSTLETQRFVDHGDDVFELRGLSAAGEELALVRRRVGTIEELSDETPGSVVGSEITLSVMGSNSREFSRELDTYHLAPDHNQVTQQFLELPTVSSTLQKDANIVVDALPTTDESAYTTSSCAASGLLTNPTAAQCCNSNGKYEMFIVRSVQKSCAAPPCIIQRSYNYQHAGAACKASDGVSSCSPGNTCAYGPQGYLKTTSQTAPGGTPYPRIESTWVVILGVGSYVCTGNWYASQQTPVFPDVTGTIATQQGCPGANEGYGSWDY